MRATLLSGVLLLVFAIAVPLALSRHGAMGLTAVALTGGVCWAAAIGAMCASSFLRSLGASVADILLPMIIRTGFPIVAALVLRLHGRELIEAGAVGYLLAFYVIALAVEVPLSLGGSAATSYNEKRRSHG